MLDYIVNQYAPAHPILSHKTRKIRVGHPQLRAQLKSAHF